MTPSETKKISAYTSGQLVQVQDVSEPLGSQGKHIDLGSIISNLKNGTIVHPTYVAPVISLSSTQSQSGLEIGQTINIPLSVAFTQNDGGTIAGTSIKKDGTQISTANSFTDSGVVMSATPKVYLATVSYGQGAVKNNNFGDADAVGRISSGSVNSNSLIYIGYHFAFFGPVASNPGNSAAARALSSQIETNKTVILNTGTTLQKFAIILPPGNSIISVTDIDALGEDITSNYSLINGSFSINDAGGNAYSSKLYVLTQSIPYSSNHRHQIIFS